MRPALSGSRKLTNTFTSLALSLSVSAAAFGGFYSYANADVLNSACRAVPKRLSITLSDDPCDPIPLPEFLVEKYQPSIPDIDVPDPPAGGHGSETPVDPGTDVPVIIEPDKEYDYSAPVPLSDKVGQDYFNDALFIGDSRTVGFRNYTGVTAYAKVALNISSVNHIKFLSLDSNGNIYLPADGNGDLTVIEAIAAKPVFNKVYICFGLNELGWGSSYSFINAYKNFIKSVQELLPDAQIYIQSVIPVSEHVSQTSTNGVTNSQVVKYNELIQSMCESFKIYFVNSAEVFTSSSGALIDGISSDGIHLGKVASNTLMEYLCTHTVEQKNN